MQSTQTIQRTYYLLTSVFWLAAGLPIAIAILLAQARGLDLFQIGLMMGLYSLTIVILEVPTGGLADAIGRKKVAILAYSFKTASALLLLFSFSFPMIITAFILMGVGRALSSGALDAWFVDSLQEIDPEFDLQPAFAKAGTFSLLSLGIGALLGSAIPQLFSDLPKEGTAILTPLSMPFFFSFLVSLLLVILTALLVKERLETDSAKWLDGFKNVPAIIKTGITLSWRNHTLLLLFGVSTISGFTLSGLEAFWQPRFAFLLGEDAGKTVIFGVLMSGNFFFGMLGNIVSPHIARVLHKRYALVAAIFQGMWGTSIVLLATQSTPIPAGVFFWLAYLSMGIVNSPYQTLLNQEIPSEQRSAMLSMASFSGYIGGMLGGLLLGYLAKNSGIGEAWMLAGIAAVVSLALYWKINVRRSKELVQTQERLSEAQS